MGLLMNITYLDAVNEVLVRLRETPVTAPTDTAYSRLIGTYINDAKRQVEDAYNWNALSATITVDTSDNIFRYIMTGSGQRFRVLDAINQEKDWFMIPETTGKMNELFMNQGTVLKGPPERYNFNGTDANGDTFVDLYPVPDGDYSIYFNVIAPTPKLVGTNDTILVPSEPVIFLAYSKALVERGEDNGLLSSEAYQLYLNSLADHIAIESNKYQDEITWVGI
jgi:predicted nucleic acid-binding Zn ribbon protein